MYVPLPFQVTDAATLQEFMEAHSFATLITTHDGEPFASHIPLLLDRTRGNHGTLVGHVSKDNPHWNLLDGKTHSLAIFHGPHAYVSPSWYSGRAPAVPTWNYATVHAYGPVTAFTDGERMAELLARTIDTYESRFDEPWQENLPDELRRQLHQAIIGFEMPIARLEGKFKLSQNRIPEDQRGAREGLRQHGHTDLADLMEKHAGIRSEPADD